MSTTTLDRNELSPDRPAPGLLGLAERGLLPDALLRAGIRRANIQGHTAPAQACGEGIEVGASLGHVQQHHVGAVAGQGFGDGRANAAGGAGDQCFAPGQRASPVLNLSGAWGKAQHLAADVSTFRRQKKPQRAFKLSLGTFADIQQLHGGTLAQFLGQ